MYKTLIVEDDPMVATIHKQYLNSSPQFRFVESCSDGLSALKYLETHDVDLVVLDVHMPNLDGLETLRQIRKNNWRVSVVLSGVTVRRYLSHLVKQGVVESQMDYEMGGRPRLLYRLTRPNE